MLLHILQGNMTEARTVYQTLQEKFPEGKEGYIFSLVAKSFWEKYNTSQSVDEACKEAIRAAEKYQDYLHFLGSDYHNIEQDIEYTPQDVCSLK
jgi:hypothetical protein